jgi:P-type Cu2+ transporter
MNQHNHDHNNHQPNHSSDRGKRADEEKGHDHNHGHSHHEHHKMMMEDFKWRFWWVLGLTIPILVLSPMIQDFLSVDWRFAGDTWILAALSSVVYFFGGWPFLTGLADELKKRNRA